MEPPGTVPDAPPEHPGFFDFFISYPRETDRGYAGRLAEELRKLDASVWLDVRDMPSLAPDWQQEVRLAIEASGTFVALLSHEYFESQACGFECGHALDTRRNLAVVEQRPIEKPVRQGLAPALTRPAWLESKEPDVVAKALIESIRTDRVLLRELNRLESRCRVWRQQERPRESFLRGRDLEDALANLGRARRAGVEVTDDLAEFVKASHSSREFRSYASFHVGLAVILAAIVWLTIRSDGWQAWQVYRSGLEAFSTMSDGTAIEWSKAFIAIGRDGLAGELAREGRDARNWSARAAGVAATLFDAGRPAAGMAVLTRTLRTKSVSGVDLFDLEGDPVRVVARRPQSTHPALKLAAEFEPLLLRHDDPLPVQFADPPGSRLTPRSVDLAQAAVDQRDADRETDVDQRDALLARAAASYAALKQPLLADVALGQTMTASRNVRNAALDILWLDRLSAQAKLLDLPDREFDFAVRMYWRLREPLPLFANRVWALAAAQMPDDPDLRANLRAQRRRVADLPPAIRAVASVSVAQPTSRALGTEEGTRAIEVALAALPEIHNRYVRSWIAARAADALVQSGARDRAQRLLRAQYDSLAHETVRMAPLLQALVRLQLGAALATAGDPQTGNEYGLLGLSLLNKQPSSDRRLIASAIGAQIAPILYGGDPSLYLVGLVMDGTKAHGAALVSQAAALAAEVLAQLETTPGLKRSLPPSATVRALQSVSVWPSRRDAIERTLPLLLSRPRERRAELLKSGLDGPAFSFLASHLEDVDTDLAQQAFDRVDLTTLSGDASAWTIRNLARALARRGEFREARAMAERNVGDERLAALAQVLQAYGRSRFQRFVASLW